MLCKPHKHQGAPREERSKPSMRQRRGDAALKEVQSGRYQPNP